MKLSVSFLKSNYDKQTTIQKIENLKEADYIHVDITDGKYCESEKMNLKEIIELLKDHQKPLDIHLMVTKPIKYIKKLIKLKPEYISVHLDTKDSIEKIHGLLAKNNIKLGVVLNPDDKESLLVPYHEIVEQILVLSVYPGKGGQTFIENTTDKLRMLYLTKPFHKALISVDGGINDKTIEKVKYYADMAVSGSYICCSDNYEEKAKELVKLGTFVASPKIQRWNRFVGEIANKNLDELNETQKIAVICNRYDSEVNNGGHGVYFDSNEDIDNDELLEALKIVANSKIAKNFEKAMQLSEEDDTEEVDEVFFSFKPSLSDYIEKYVEKNKKEIFK